MAGTVHPILFIGCGGSGGVTLRFTMDALRVEVARWNDARVAKDGPSGYVDFGRTGLPLSWQFLHIDVPTVPDGNASDRPPSVPEQGGRYVTIAPPGFQFRTLSDQLWAKVENKSTRHLMAGWLKAPDPATDPVLTAGAGQMRNVGRAVTLYSLPKINAGLGEASGALVSAGARQDLFKLSRLVGATTAPDQPLVFIVSSMSGGAGASMVLDVARLLARLRPTWREATSMFLYTSEVFSELPEKDRTGVEGNGLAAMGELLATSLGANGQRHVNVGDSEAVQEAARLEALYDENRLLADLGIAAGGDAESQTFRRVFPIGNTQGSDAALFGDGSMDVVYRAIGRGLAGLVASPTALSEFLAYDLTNPSAITTELSWLGAGSKSSQSVLWGSFCFARLSLGRDKYGEYFAQRIARAAVDRLAGASEGPKASAERDIGIAADAAFASMLVDLKLPGGAANAMAFIGRSSTAEAARAQIVAPIRELLARSLYQQPFVAGANTGPDFVLHLNRQGVEQARPLMRQINEMAYASAYAWVREFTADVLRLIELVAARLGVPVARAVSLKLNHQTSSWSRQLMEAAQSMAPMGGAALPPPPAAELDQISKLPAFTRDHELVQRLRTKHVDSAGRLTAGRICGLIAEALGEFGDRVVGPLSQALKSTIGTLEAERTRVPEGRGVAESRTEADAEWPGAHSDVPLRFHGAHNEVMLIDPGSFRSQIEADFDLIRSARGLESRGEAHEAILKEILTDRWAGHNDESAKARTITMTTTWVPSNMVRDPERADLARVATPAVFTIDASPAAVMQRSRAWVSRPTGELAPFLRQGIRGYLSELDGSPSTHRRDELAAKFGVALQHAAPLVQVSGPIFGLVHPGIQLEIMYKFSGVPLRDAPGAPADALRSILRDSGSAPEAVRGFDDSLDDNDATSHVDVFGSYAPISPLAVPSLLKPLASAITRVHTAGAVGGFWRNRRARPLAGSLAMSPDERRALVAGYLVGRMTGRLRGSYQVNPYERQVPLAVFAELREDAGTWLDFPQPLLTPYIREYEGDEVAAILEAHLVALALCGFDTTLSPLRPYTALRSLFGAPTDQLGEPYDPSLGAVRYLTKLIVDDATIEGSGRRIAGASQSDAQGRKGAALTYIDNLEAGVKANFGGDDPTSSKYIDRMRYTSRPLLSSLAPDLTWALRNLRTLVVQINPAEVPSGGQAIDTKLSF